METPLISIIVPVYNVAPYLAECLDSVIAQSYKHIEIILVDDGSTDQSGQICDQYAGRDPRITVIHKKNGGLSEARNVGIDRARGEYLAFVDSDDAILPSFINDLYSYISNHHADMALCNYERFEHNYAKSYKSDTLITFSRAQAFDKFYEYDFIVPCVKLYKKEIFDVLRFPVGKKHEDEFIAHHVLYKCSKIVLYDAPLYKYRQRQGGIMSHYSLQRYLDARDAMLDRIKFAKINQLPEFRKASIRRLVEIQIYNRHHSAEIANVIDKDIVKNLYTFAVMVFKYNLLSIKDLISILAVILMKRYA